MKKGQQGFSVIEVLLFLSITVLIGFVGWYIFVRPSMQSRSQLTKVIDAVVLPTSFRPTKTVFSEEHPELTTIFSISRDYDLTTPTTRAQALQQIVKGLGLNPADHHTVDIYDEQLNGVDSPLFPFPGNGKSFKFFAKLSPSYNGYSPVNDCDKAQEDTAFRACINQSSAYGMNALVKNVQIEIDKE